MNPNLNATPLQERTIAEELLPKGTDTKMNMHSCGNAGMCNTQGLQTRIDAAGITTFFEKTLDMECISYFTLCANRSSGPMPAIGRRSLRSGSGEEVKMKRLSKLH
ncbi:hypothetical protein [Cohnella laeviribosi]|uniref:hypothetical protein n=1 Tax=Cohnella laeviribosi TaxID=380174 RepID=UPI00037F49B8|nr:hypothetical protein [Cohnella laeviribosi]